MSARSDHDRDQSPNAYLGSRPALPLADELIGMALGSITHPEFGLNFTVGPHRLDLRLSLRSDTRHVPTEVQRLLGSESPAELVELVAAMMGRAYLHDARQRLTFRGVPLLARGV